nr:MAG TPA: hypothetical protein [Caudoviricetes sp.]
MCPACALYAVSYILYAVLTNALLSFFPMNKHVDNPIRGGV